MEVEAARSSVESHRVTRIASGVRSNWGLVVAAAVGVGAYAAMAWIDASRGTIRAALTPWTVALYLVAFGGFLLAIWWNERHRIPWRWLWVIPIVFRVILLFTTPTLSDDVYRYLWDGHLSSEGVNPYTYPLDDPRLDEYEIDARALANNPTYGTPYLPAAQLVFAATARVLPSEPLSLQMVMLAFDMLAALVIVRLLALAELPRSRLMLYLWNPLVVVEIAHAAHLDAMMIALALLAVLLTLRRSTSVSMVAAPLVLALATLTRFLPVLLLPVLWWKWTWLQRCLYGLGVVVLVVPYAVGAGWGLTGESTRTGVFGSTRAFVQEVTFNGGVYSWLESLLRGRGVDDSASTARWITAVVLAAIVIEVARRARYPSAPREALRLVAVPFLGFVVLTSIFHPWYLLVVVGLLPFVAPGQDEDERMWWSVVPWLYLCATVALSYLTYRDPSRFGEIEWVWRVEWIPTLTLLGLAVWVARGRHRGDPALQEPRPPR